MIRLLYFAWVRERMGRGEESLSPPGSIATVADLVDWLAGLDPVREAALADRHRLRAAVDGRFVGMEAPVVGAREVALFPPVTGG